MKSALSRIAKAQNYPCPVKPKILNSVSVYRSIFAKDIVYSEMLDLLRETIVDWKEKLNEVKAINVVDVSLMLKNSKNSLLKNFGGFQEQERF